MSDLNPYASPATPEPSAPTEALWYTDSTGVLVRDGAVVPPVCLETGATGDLHPLKRSIRRPHWTNGIGTILFIIYLAIPPSMREAVPKSMQHYDFLAVLGVCILLALILRKKSKRIHFEYHILKSIHRNRRNRSIFRNVLIFISIGMLVSAPFLPIAFPESYRIPDTLSLLLISLAAGILGILWKYLDRPKNHIKPASDTHWMRIGNVHLDAVQKLRLLEREP